MTMRLPRSLWPGASLAVLALAALTLPSCQTTCRTVGCPDPGRPSSQPTAPFAHSPDGCPKLGDAFVCVTVRPRGQLGLKLDGSDTPLLDGWLGQVGIPLRSVECFAAILLDGGGRRVLAVRTTTPIAQGTVQLVCSATTPSTYRDSRPIYTGRAGLVVHFPEPRLALIADSVATIDACLAEMATMKAMVSAQRRADLEIAVNVPKGKERLPQRLFGEMPIADLEIERGSLEVVVADDLSIQAEVRCRNAATARKAAALLETGIDSGRAMLMMALAQFRAMQAFPDEVNQMGSPDRDKVKAMLALLPLLRKLEAGLGATRPEASGRVATFRARLPVGGKELGAALKEAMSLVEGQAGMAGSGPGLIFGPCERPAQAALPVCRAPMPPPAPLVQATSVPPPAPISPPLSPYVVGPGGLPRVPMASPPPPPFPPAQPPPSGFSTPPPTLTPPRPPTTVVAFTVANVRKEPVLLFVPDAGGELTFVRKVPSGEAVDLRAPLGQRWTAVFMSAPHKTTHVIQGDRGVWLVR